MVICQLLMYLRNNKVYEEKYLTPYWWIALTKDHQCKDLVFWLLIAWMRHWTNNWVVSDWFGMPYCSCDMIAMSWWILSVWYTQVLKEVYIQHIAINLYCIDGLTHWGRATHICIGNLTIISSDNGLLPGRRQAIIWTNAGILLIRPLGTNFNEILIEILTFSFMKMRLKVLSAKWRPFCLGLNVLSKTMLSPL